jgi:hypothetical protein
MVRISDTFLKAYREACRLKAQIDDRVAAIEDLKERIRKKESMRGADCGIGAWIAQMEKDYTDLEAKVVRIEGQITDVDQNESKARKEQGDLQGDGDLEIVYSADETIGTEKGWNGELTYVQKEITHSQGCRIARVDHYGKVDRVNSYSTHDNFFFVFDYNHRTVQGDSNMRIESVGGTESYSGGTSGREKWEITYKCPRQVIGTVHFKVFPLQKYSTKWVAT